MKYKIGDKVKIKSWDAMVAEFGVDESGGIPCKYGFVPEMKQFADTIMTIEYIDYEDHANERIYKYIYMLEDLSHQDINNYGFAFSDDMIEYKINTSESD